MNPAYLSGHHQDDSANTYFRLRRESDGFIWDVGSAAFEAVGTWNNTRADECDIPATNRGAFFFNAAFPAVQHDIIYIVEFCLRVGGSPAAADPILNTKVVNEHILIPPRAF